MDVATGEVLTQRKPLHQAQEFLGLLRQIERSVLDDLDVHLVVENICASKNAVDRRSCVQR
jgi:putative transposase